MENSDDIAHLSTDIPGAKMSLKHSVSTEIQPDSTADLVPSAQRAGWKVKDLGV
jgi:hypothetical protein